MSGEAEGSSEQNTSFYSQLETPRLESMARRTKSARILERIRNIAIIRAEENQFDLEAEALAVLAEVRLQELRTKEQEDVRLLGVEAASRAFWESQFNV